MRGKGGVKMGSVKGDQEMLGPKNRLERVR